MSAPTILIALTPRDMAALIDGENVRYATSGGQTVIIRGDVPDWAPTDPDTQSSVSAMKGNTHEHSQ